MPKQRRLQDAYRFPGFQPLARVRGVFGDPKLRIVQLVRRRKKRRVVSAGRCIERSTINGAAEWAIWHAAICGSTWSWRCGGSTAAGVVQ